MHPRGVLPPWPRLGHVCLESAQRCGVYLYPKAQNSPKALYSRVLKPNSEAQIGWVLGVKV